MSVPIEQDERHWGEKKDGRMGLELCCGFCPARDIPTEGPRVKICEYTSHFIPRILVSLSYRFLPLSHRPFDPNSLACLPCEHRLVSVVRRTGNKKRRSASAVF